MQASYQICSRCVMDTSDPQITFDDSGVCKHCLEFDAVTRKRWFPDERGSVKLAASIERIKKDGEAKPYDCVLGLSGGADSSYLALRAREWGLRPLVMHVDAGWNTDFAASNIQEIVRYCDYKLHTHVVDWQEMRDLQLAYLRSGVVNQDVPQDHAFFANLYSFAAESDINWVLSGANLATEAIFPASWQGSAMDAINLRAIHKKFGRIPLSNYKTISFFDYYIYYPFIKRMRVFRPLDYMAYHKGDAIALLEEKTGWRSYERKHGESVFTRFFQNYYLPTRFGYDKRRPHLSSLIVSGQLTREKALADLEEPLYGDDALAHDKAYIAARLDLTLEEFEELLLAKPSSHRDFPNWEGRQRVAHGAARLLASIRKSGTPRVHYY